MRRFALPLLCLITLSGCSPQTPLTADQFTKMYASEMQKTFPALKIVVKGDKELLVADASGDERRSFLDNCYQEYLADPTAKATVVQKYLEAYGELLASKDVVDPGRITPVIKDRPWLEEIRMSTANSGIKQEPQFVYDDFNPELVILYAEDSPKNLRYLTPKDLDAAKLKKEDLRKLAIRNLRSLLPRMEIKGGNGRYVITAGGTYEASLLLFDELWTGNKLTVDGDVVVAVPSRDLLLVTGSRNEAGLAILRKIAQQTLTQSSYQLTSELFVLKNGNFERFNP